MKLEDFKNKKIPEVPGVYLFKDKNREILYIGKAGSLKDRTASYFLENIAETRGALIAQMVERAEDLEFMETDSVLEAFVWEAKLIKQNQPLYNIKAKDDKTFNYVVITEEDFPKVVVAKESELNYKFSVENIKYVFGPFPHGALFKEAFKKIRQIFPFRGEKCFPYMELKDKTKVKPCFSRQIELCPGVCTGEISKTDYARSIQHLRLFFDGKKKALIKQIEKEMKSYAETREFEKATQLRKTLKALSHIQDVSLLKKDIIPKDEKKFRIEAYDAAHISGSNAVGVMVVIENGEIKKSDYRKFKIKVANKSDDVGALREIISRRIRHSEWEYPDLIVVDGGKAQKRAAEKIFKKFKIDTPVLSVLKDERHKPKDILGNAEMKKRYEREILLSNMEAHRFAVAYHRNKRDKLE